MKKAVILLAVALVTPTVVATAIVLVTAAQELRFQREMEKLDLNKTIAEQL